MNKQNIWNISNSEKEILIQAGFLTRKIRYSRKENDLKSISLSVVSEKVSNTELLEMSSSGLSLSFYLASPNERPKGITLNENLKVITQDNSEKNKTDGLNISENADAKTYQNVSWINAVEYDNLEKNIFTDIDFEEKSLANDTQQLIITLKNPIKIDDKDYLKDVSVSIIYEIRREFTSIRKWVSISNKGSNWIKIDNLTIDSILLKKEYRKNNNLTPSERGACASIIGKENKNKTKGIILASEIPSALRNIQKTGSMEYQKKYFEWIIGPDEEFTSEPVFHFGFEGKVIKTISSKSYPLDRCVEGIFKKYLEKHIGIRAIPEELCHPLWCTWSNFVSNINDQIVRDMSDIASKCGFKILQIDAGWAKSVDNSSWSAGSAEPHESKFANFKETCDYIQKKGLKLGLWTSCFREMESKDLRDLPNSRVLPLIKRNFGFGMSFASDWAEYYGKDIVNLHEKYGAVYFKQDLTLIKHGDIAEGHYSRSLKESYLQGLRGFFKSQDYIHEKAPKVQTLLSHEIYWGTPGVPADIAALKHCWSVHIPPNDYSGVFPRNKRYNKDDFDSKSKVLQWQLIRGCYHSRNRNYLHRGLPLYGVEYYGAGTLNANGNLTPEIQDRQICSWLMGVPSVYAGDLASLTEENIKRYKKRFDLILDLQEKYGIYRHFQYSGVPKPDKLDFKWHWWGKINDEGNGIVVVIRGRYGKSKMNINIPWINEDKEYSVKKLLTNEMIGNYSGKNLQNGVLNLKLPKFGQEILELRNI